MAEMVGWFGAAFLLIAYGLLSKGWIKDNLAYQSLNLIGAAGIAVSSLNRAAYPAMWLNIIWMLIAAISIWKRVTRTDEEDLQA